MASALYNMKLMKINLSSIHLYLKILNLLTKNNCVEFFVPCFR